MLKQNNHLLQATSDTEPLIFETFIHNGMLTDLHFHPEQLKLIQKDHERVIPVKFGLTYRILIKADGKAVGIEFNNFGECLILLRDFWNRACQWEETLLKHMTRQDFHEFFRPVKKIGCGNFATVYLAEDIRLKKRVAIKAFMKEVAFKGEGKAAIQNEIKLMRRIKSENIVEFYGVYETKNSLYLVMEYVEGMTLDTFLKRNKEVSVEMRKNLLKGLLNGLKCLHQLQILHRDLKPQNIMVSSNFDKVKIVDFGLATNINEPRYVFVRCGTPGYVAPEILKIRDSQNARLTLPADVFSLGVVYYQVLYGKPLFEGKDQQEVLTKNRICQIHCPDGRTTGYGETDMLRSLLAAQPNFRATPESALESYFLREKKELRCRALRTIENTMPMEDESDEPACGFWVSY